MPVNVMDTSLEAAQSDAAKSGDATLDNTNQQTTTQSDASSTADKGNQESNTNKSVQNVNTEQAKQTTQTTQQTVSIESLKAELEEYKKTSSQRDAILKKILLERKQQREEAERKASQQSTQENADEFYGYKSIQEFEEKYKNNPRELANLIRSVVLADRETFKKELVEPGLKPIRDMELRQLHQETFNEYPEFAPGTEGFKAGQEWFRSNQKLAAVLDQAQNEHGINATAISGMLANYKLMKGQLAALQEKYEGKGAKDATKATATQVSAGSETKTLDDDMKELMKEYGVTDEEQAKQILRTANNSFGGRKR